MRSFRSIERLVLLSVILASLLTGCVVVERPYYEHDGYRGHHHGYYERDRD